MSEAEIVSGLIMAGTVFGLAAVLTLAVAVSRLRIRRRSTYRTRRH